MDENGTFLPTAINEIDANFQVIQQVLVLGISERHGHPHELQVATGVLERVKKLIRRERRFGGASPGVRHVDFGDFLGRDGDAGTPFREEGDGGGTEYGENVRDAVNGVVLKNPRRVADVADREVLSYRVRHHSESKSKSKFKFKFKFDCVRKLDFVYEKLKRSAKLGNRRKTSKRLGRLE